MTPEQALKIIDDALAQVKVDRQTQNLLINALRTIDAVIVKSREKKPEEMEKK